MIILKFIHGLMLMVMITGCTDQAKSTAEILQDGQRREEIMVAISKDHEMMNEMMDQMMMNMMEKDTAMAKMMMDNMMGIMEKDSTMSNIMGGMMMGNKHMMSMMQQMGKSGGMMPHNRQ